MRIAVTGATGFIGSHLVPSLVAAGHIVSAPGSEGAPVIDVVTGEGMPAAFSGCGAVIHLAARNHVLKENEADPLAAYRRVNVEGTRNVVREAVRAGARLFVHMSSVKAMGEESEAVLDENSPCAPKTSYGISKLESEEVVMQEAGKSGMRAVILRLPMTYGPGNRGNLPRMVRWAERGWPFPFFSPGNLRSMVYVGNLASGIMASLERAPAEPVSTYILKDAEDHPTADVYAAICRELGRSPRLVHVPATAVRLLGRLSQDFRTVTGSFRVSCAKAEQEIGYMPPFSFEEGIAKTVAWCIRSAS